MTVNTRDHAIILLAQGFTEDFVEFVRGNERLHEVMQDLASEFVADNIPIVDEEAAFDVACELLMSTTVKAV